MACWGLLGGCSAELLRWFRIRDQLHRGVPDWAKSLAYWVVTVLMILSGGALVLMYEYSGTSLTPALAANVGAAAPLVLSSLSANLPSAADVG